MVARAGLLELLGVLVIVVGCCGVVAAATYVSVALAVLAAGLFLIFGGVIAVYVAGAIEKTPAKKPPTP